jgi:hypothetical protein
MEKENLGTLGSGMVTGLPTEFLGGKEWLGIC